MLGGYLILSLLVGYRLVSIQVLHADQYRGLAARQVQREVELPASRGRLYDRAGEPLAMSLAAATIYANPRQLAEHPTLTPAAVAAQLSPVLKRPAAELAEDLAKDTGFVYLARQIDRTIGDQVTEMALPGVGVLTEARRVYPADGLAAQVVGFAGVDGDGLAGLELSLDSKLAGTPGRVHLERAPRGLEISTAPRQIQEPRPGTDAVLTIDREIQAATERALQKAVEGYNADGGSAVVLDAKSGEILAMASMPTFSPSDISEADVAARRNRSLTDIFEPGSVNKVITAAAALDEGLVTPRTRFTVPAGYRIGDKTFSDSHAPAKPKLTVHEIMETSSNIGTIKIAERVGSEKLYEYLRRFGYGEETGLDFPGESAGLLPHPALWSVTSLPTISIGQGVSATLLQVAQVFSTVANDGVWREPTLVRGVVAADGSVKPLERPKQRRVISAGTADALAAMLRDVVHSDDGTCDQCRIPGYNVGGKTGTAQKPSETRRGYEPGAYVGSFVGFAPTEDPALVVGVTLDEPRPVYYGGLTAGPTFQKIMSFALNHRRIPPSRPRTPQAQPAEGVVTLTSTVASPLTATEDEAVAGGGTVDVEGIDPNQPAVLPDTGAQSYVEGIPLWAQQVAVEP